MCVRVCVCVCVCVREREREFHDVDLFNVGDRMTTLISRCDELSIMLFSVAFEYILLYLGEKTHRISAVSDRTTFELCM